MSKKHEQPESEVKTQKVDKTQSEPKHQSGPSGPKPKDPKKEMKSQARQILMNNIAGIVVVFAILFALYGVLSDGAQKPEQISVSQLVTDINTGTVKSVEVSGADLAIEYQDGTKKESKKELDSALTTTLDNLGVDTEKLRAVSIASTEDRGFGFWAANILPFLLPVIILFFIIWFLTRQAKGAQSQAFGFGQTRARLITPDDSKEKITFKDVAGAKEAKSELAEIVDFLKNPKKFIDIGARIPKGILLMGAPGTGKTLLARAVAGEAGVSFFSVSGAEFVEMFVGVGASRVRDLFKMAKAGAPAIIFIDEIDAVGRVRGTGIGGGNDEREQTLNQILVEMDGFEPNEAVIIMAATNRPDVLDPALLRPGRFDRRVTIDLPDRGDRLAILEVHSKNKPLAEDVNLELIAERTPGFSGADLHSLMNEGAIVAAREERKKLGQFDLIRSIEKVMLGPERKSHILSKKEKELTAYHEAGHALLASVLPHADPVHKVSIISRGRAAGYTLKLPLDERKMMSKNQFLDDIVVSLGGYVVEKHIFNDLTTGSSNDLQVSTALARDMVTKYGMSDEIGPIALESYAGRTVTGQAIEDRDYSEVVGTKIDQEVSKIMKEAYKKALDIITEKRPVLDAIAKALVQAENLEQKEYEQIIVAHGIELKKKEDTGE
ncbi:MAG: cell division protein FtsH, cell division protease FtsH [Candidatus Parcubacteria bacterium]|jgi:cell division protease FtsH